MSNIISSKDRRELLLSMADRPNGTSVNEVHQAALEKGDHASIEAYHNLARRLMHRGLLSKHDSETGAIYKTVTASSDSEWLEEDQLATLIDPEYPLLALTVWKESQRQLGDIPESLWIELRERLKGENAQELFINAIRSYCDDFRAQIANLTEEMDLHNNDYSRNHSAAEVQTHTNELSNLKREAENSRLLLQRLVKYGLGISKEAVLVPLNVSEAVTLYQGDRSISFYDADLLAQEVKMRVSPENFICDIPEPQATSTLLIAATDGSTRSGVLNFLDETGDFVVSQAPTVTINTAIGQINRNVKHDEKKTSIFLRLPEKPEDMQRQDNKYTIMAKLFYPDLSDSEYMHSVSNAMDFLESKAALRTMSRWYLQNNNGIEIPACDIVLRDGTITPQDRDFNHYKTMSTYGKIVRDLITTNWEIVKKCKDDGQTLAGVVKHAQLTVFSPVINWYACQLASKKEGQLVSWPMHTMNVAFDQVILTKMLTAGRKKGDVWERTCIVFRPYHSTSNFSNTYNRSITPSKIIMKQSVDARNGSLTTDPEQTLFWQEFFRGEHDPYIKMLENVYYGSFFAGTVPRIDNVGKTLPRFEFLVPTPTTEGSGSFWPVAEPHLNRLLTALKQNGFDVSLEHSMFADKGTMDILPTILVKAHDTVKVWGQDLISRVHEYIGYHLARYINTKKIKGIQIRPFKKEELELLYTQLKRERDLKAGSGTQRSKPMLENKNEETTE